jgi:protoporphyrinogen oxidase
VRPGTAIKRSSLRRLDASVKVDILIIGAGPTGLGASWRLDALGQTDWCLCESAESAGGLASSVVDEHGFTWDLGGHVQFSHYQYFDDLMDELLGPDGWLHHDRESWVWVRGRFVPYPFQLNLHRLPPDEQWACVRGLISAARRAAGDETLPASFSEWIDRAFGPGIASVFLRPYNWKVWAHPLDTLSWSWIGDRVATVDLSRVVASIARDTDDVSWGPNNQFRFPLRGGTGVIWRTLASGLARRHPDRMRYGARIERVDTRSRRVTLDTGETIEYRRLLSTMPLDDFVRATDLMSDLGPALGGLKHSSTHVIGVGLTGRPPSALDGKCWMYFPEDDCPFYRVTVFSHYSPNNVPDIRTCWSLMAEVSESPVKAVDVDRIVDQTVDGLLATRLVADRRLVHHVWHRRLEHGYPTPSRDRDRAIAAILPALESRDVYSRGRFGAWKYEVSNQDHSFAQGVECIDRLIDRGADHAEGSEETLNLPEVVNARRSTPRRLAAPRGGGLAAPRSGGR